jgi:hypothetical protein
MATTQPTTAFDRIVKVLSLFGGVYSLCALVWFFSTFASKAGKPLTEYLPRIIAFGTMALAPYAACWFAQYLSRSRSASVMALVVTALSALTSVVAYMPGFNPHQQGDFPVVFYLGAVQLVFALVACGYASISRFMSLRRQKIR